jgi:hypothetical protein
MRRVDPPNPTKYDLLPRLKNDPQVKKWTERLAADPEVRPTDLSEDQLAFVTESVMRLRGDEFMPTPFKQAMIDTRPVLAAPDWTDELEDMGHIFAQPELQAFWRAWRGPRRSKGPEINYAGAKAAMTVLAMTGTDKHIDKLSRSLVRDAEMKAIFEDIEGADITMPPYSSLCRHVERIASSCVGAAMEANIECMKELRALYPKNGIGKRLLLDASGTPAWARQVGAGSKEREQELRRRTPKAGFRRYAYTPGGKITVKNGETIRAGAGKLPKEWRGYYFACIADQATGLPLVWMLFDAATDEAQAIVPLLSLLHRLWPDIDADSIAGDSAFDEKEWNRLCEVDYGIAPIFRQKPSEEKKHDLVLKDKESRDASVVAITRTGQLICAEHKKPLPYYTFDRPSRAGLLPGQSSDERRFRLRAECKHTTKEHPHPCGKIGLKADTSWHRLTRYPHHSSGDPQRYAWRIAMLARLNGIEGVFNRLKAGKLLGTKGADRTRLLSIHSIEALFSMACLSMSALMLACEREHLGVAIPQPSGPTLQGVPIAPVAKPSRNPHRPSGAHHVRSRTAAGRRPAGTKPNTRPMQPIAIDFDDVQRVGFS